MFETIGYIIGTGAVVAGALCGGRGAPRSETVRDGAANATSENQADDKKTGKASNTARRSRKSPKRRGCPVVNDIMRSEGVVPATPGELVKVPLSTHWYSRTLIR